MSAVNEEARASIDDLPFREGALNADAIRRERPQFRILIIGKANAGKTTILRKVCNAKPDAKPIVYDLEGKVVQQVPTKVPLRIAQPWQKLTKFLGSHNDSHGSRCLRFFTG